MFRRFIIKMKKDLDELEQAYLDQRLLLKDLGLEGKITLRNQVFNSFLYYKEELLDRLVLFNEETDNALLLTMSVSFRVNNLESFRYFYFS